MKQIQEMAKANGQSKREWVRDLVMQALHATDRKADDRHPVESTAGLPEMEIRLGEMEDRIRQEMLAVKMAVAEAAKSLHDDLCTMAQVGLHVEESFEQRVDDNCVDVLEAIERLKQSQRSHKDTLLLAIRRGATSPGNR